MSCTKEDTAYLKNARIKAQHASEIMHKEFNALDGAQGFFTATKYPFRHQIRYDNGVTIWPPVDIAPAAVIGNDVMIGRWTNIMGKVVIGAGTRIQGFCFIPDGVTIGQRVFIGPGVMFTNVKYPKVRDGKSWRVDPEAITIEDGVSIGAGSIVCPGVRIGEMAMIGAGAVVTKDVPANFVMVGCPAREMKVE